MDKEWIALSEKIHQRFLTVCQAWGTLETDQEITKFLALALYRRSQKLVKLIMNPCDGGMTPREKMAEDMVDMRICISHLAQRLDIDLDAACGKRLHVVESLLEAAEADIGIAKMPHAKT